MPIINTRKRKPSEASALDQLAAISTQELASRRTYLPPAQRQRMNAADDDDDNNSDANSEDTDSRRRVRRCYDADANDLDRLARDIEHMKLKLRRAEHALASRRASQSHPMQWSSTHTLAEILKLQSTLETALGMDKNPGAQPLELTTANPHENFDCGPLILDAIRRDVVRLHSFLTEHRVDPDLAQHVRLPLDHLWREARADAYTEVRTKLSFWRHEAGDLKERLRVALEAIKASPSSAMPGTVAAPGTSTAATDSPAAVPTSSPSPAVVSLTVEAALERAMAFVSSFFLMDVAATSDGNSASKELAMNTAKTAIVRTLKELDEKRVETRPPLHLQPAVGFTSPRQPSGHGGIMMMQQHMWPVREPEPSPPSTSHSTTTNFFVADDDGDDPSEEDEPLPMQSSTYANSASTAAQRTTGFSSVRPAPMSSNSASTASQKKISLPLAARRRLAAVLDSQLSQGSSGSQSQERSGWSAQAARPSPLKQKPTTSYQDRVDARPRNQLDLSGSRPSMDSPSAANGCAKCGRNDSQHSLLLCDNDCGREFHTFCLSPPLSTIPDGDWFCPKCREAESLAPDQRVYLCSASLCDKITATKYCSLHRCQFDRCLNRMHSNGLCRRHEGHRGTGKHPTGTDASPTKAKAKPVATAMEATGSTAPVSHKGPAAKAKLNNDQLLSNMRDMGIWLPSRIPGKKGTKVAPVKGGRKQPQGKRA